MGLSGSAFGLASRLLAMTLLVVVGYGVVRLAAAPEIGSLETVSVASFTMVENHVGELNELLDEEGVVGVPARNAGGSCPISGDDGNGDCRRCQNHPLAGTSHHRR